MSSSKTITKNDLKTVLESVLPTKDIGTVKYAAMTANKSTSSNTPTMMCSISLDAGVWVITAGLRWATNATGLRRMNISTTSAASDIMVQEQAVNGDYTQMNMTRIETVASNGTIYYLNGAQKSGGTLDAYHGGNNWGTYITAVRIA